MKKKLEKKNLIIMGIFLIFIVIIVFGGALIYNKFFYKRTYSEVETIMLNAAKEHFSKNEDKLPQNINDTVILTEDSLVKNEEMKTIDSYLKNKEKTCTGEVKVTNINEDKYRYSVMLDCGKKNYQDQIFTDYIEDNVSIVESGNGLYNLNNELVYRGDNVDNYIKISEATYRIVKFKDGYTVAIFTDKFETAEWDNRYNIERNDASGINDYKISRIRDYLGNLYEGNTFLTESDKLLVTQYDLPIGKRSNNDTDKTGSLENSEVLEGQYIGLLPVYDFLNASLDVNCTSTVSLSCSNYNYLSKYKFNWWSITANSKNTYKIYRINGLGTAETASAASSGYVRPVIYLVKDLIYVSGDGSKSNPYIVK